MFLRRLRRISTFFRKAFLPEIGGLSQHRRGVSTVVVFDKTRISDFKACRVMLARAATISRRPTARSRTVSRWHFNPLMLTDKGIIGEVFQGEMLIRTLPTTPLQIFCEFIPNFKDIAKSSRSPDDNS